MYPDWGGPAAYGAGFLAIFIWLMVLSYFIWRNSIFLNSLFPKNKRSDIREKFEEIVGLIDKSSYHLQRVALFRYNPYDDTGGDQSFSLALLDDKGNGIIVTSLHSRSGTRVFAKPVISGGSAKYRFSKEEEEVIKRAMAD